MNKYNGKYLKYKNKYLNLKKQVANGKNDNNTNNTNTNNTNTNNTNNNNTNNNDTNKNKNAINFNGATIHSDNTDSSVNKLINNIISKSYKYNLKIRTLSDYDIETFGTKQSVIEKLNELYEFNTKSNKDIVNAIKQNPKFAKEFFNSKDLTDEPVRFYKLIQLLEYVINKINEQSNQKEKLKYIFFLIEYIIGYQIWSDGNHRTAIFIAKKLIKQFIGESEANHFDAWYLSNFYELNTDSHFGKLMTYNQTDDTYDFTFDFDHLLRHPNNNFNYMVELFIEYLSAQTY